MKSNDDFEDAKALATGIIGLFFVLVIVGIALYYADFYCSANKAPRTLFDSVFLSAFGSIHLFFSKSVSFLYNMQKKIIPFAPVATAKLLRVVGAISLFAGLLMFIFTIYKPA